MGAFRPGLDIVFAAVDAHGFEEEDVPQLIEDGCWVRLGIVVWKDEAGVGWRGCENCVVDGVKAAKLPRSGVTVLKLGCWVLTALN